MGSLGRTLAACKVLIAILLLPHASVRLFKLVTYLSTMACTVAPRGNRVITQLIHKRLSCVGQ